VVALRWLLSAAAVASLLPAGCDWMYLPPEHPTLVKPLVEQPAQQIDLSAEVRDS
jgi:hypothetical protein